jgi:hypothetical protein
MLLLARLSCVRCCTAAWVNEREKNVMEKGEGKRYFRGAM